MNFRLLGALLVLGAMAVAVACGGSSDNNSGSNPTADATDSVGEPAGGGNGLQTPTISVNSPDITVGQEGEVTVSILNAEPPGVGAWTVDVTYDTSIVSATNCEALQGVNACNAEFTGDTVRVTGAIAEGLVGTNVVGRLTFRCEQAGESQLSVHVETLADGTIGDPQNLTPIINNGAITCA